MTTKSSNKTKKSLIALGVILAIGAIALGVTTHNIKNQINSQIDGLITQTNQSIEANSAFILKPKFSLKELSSGFFQTDFTLSVDVENFNKTRLKTQLIEIKNDLSREYSYYEESDLKAAEEAVAQAPDFIHLFDIENVAKHGPFPNISQFDLSLALLGIESAVSYKNINPAAITFLQGLSTDPSLQSQLENHQYLTGNTTVTFDNNINSTLTSAPFNLVLDKIGSQFKFDGIKTHFNGSGNTFDLQTQISKLDFIVLDKSSEKTSKPLTQAEQKPMLSLDGIDLKINYQAAEIADVSYELTLHPLRYLTPEQDFQNSDRKHEILFDGLSVNYMRNLNADKETFLDKSLLTLKTLKINSTLPSYSYAEDEEYQNSTKEAHFEITPITLTSQMNQTPKALYIVSEKHAEEALAKFRKLITDGDVNAFILNDRKGLKEELNKNLEIYRNLVGELTMKSSPFDITYNESQAEDKKEFISNIGTMTINLGKSSLDETNPLTVDLLLDSIKGRYQNSDVEETVSNVNVELKNLGTKASISLNQINPLSLTSSLEEFSVSSNNSPLLGFNNLAYEIGLTREKNSADFYDGISVNDIKVRGLELGDYKVRYTLANINQSAIDTYIDMLAKAYDLGMQSAYEPMDYFQLIQEDMNIAINQLLSKELEFTLSPVHLSNAVGNTDLSFSVKMKPTTLENVVAQSQDYLSTIDLIQSASFDLTTDINHLADVGSKVALIAQTPINQEINSEELKQTKEQFAQIIPLPFSGAPLNQFFQLTENQIKSNIVFDNGKWVINGEPSTTEEIFSMFGL